MHGTLTALPAELAGFAHYGLVAHEVGNDSMQPTIWARDIVFAAPVAGYAGEGIYVFRLTEPSPHRPWETSCYRVWGEKRDGKRMLALARDNKLYWRDGKISPDYVDAAWFRENVLGKVAIHCRVIEHGLMRGVAL